MPIKLNSFIHFLVHFDRTVTLWQKKQLRLRQNMIFATIKVVKGWDFDQFLAMGADQRNAIRRALNDDAEKLLQEGDPADPQLRRLRREMDEVNKLFDDFERRARAEGNFSFLFVQHQYFTLINRRKLINSDLKWINSSCVTL